MPTAKHTPGPWIVSVLTTHYDRLVITPQYAPYNTLAVISMQDSQREGARDKATEQANAALIAAAPDLLAAAEYTCDQMVYHIEKCGRTSLKPALGKLMDAIAKAKKGVV